MLANLSDLAALDLTPTVSAMDAISEETVCFLCGAPPMPATSEGAIVAWCKEFSPGDFEIGREALENGYPLGGTAEPDGGRTSVGDEWQKRARQLRYDTKLEVVALLSLDQLERLLEYRDFIEEALPTVACGRCAVNDFHWNQVPEQLHRLMIRRYGDGNENAARAQPIWDEFEEFLSAIRAIARSKAS